MMALTPARGILTATLLGVPLLAGAGRSPDRASDRQSSAMSPRPTAVGGCAVDASNAARATQRSPAGMLGGPRAADGTTEFRILRRAHPDEPYTPMGTMTVEQRTFPNRDLVRRVITYDYGDRGGVVDTTLSVRSTLLPICERTHKSSGAAIALDFAGTTVSGYMGDTSGRRIIADTFATPAFNTTDLDLLVPALPLRDGYHISLPVYDPEFGGYRRAEVAVSVGSGSARVWRVVARDRRHETTYMVDDATRAVLDHRVRARDGGVEFEIRPVAGAGGQ